MNKILMNHPVNKKRQKDAVDVVAMIEEYQRQLSRCSHPVAKVLLKAEIDRLVRLVKEEGEK